MAISRLTRLLFWTVIATATTFGLFIIYAKLTELSVGPSQKSWAHDVILRDDPKGKSYMVMVLGTTAVFIFFLLKLAAQTYDWLRGRPNVVWDHRSPFLFWLVILFMPGVSQTPVVVLTNLIKDFSIDPALVEIGMGLFLAILTLCPLLGLSATYDFWPRRYRTNQDDN